MSPELLEAEEDDELGESSVKSSLCVTVLEEDDDDATLVKLPKKEDLIGAGAAVNAGTGTGIGADAGVFATSAGGAVALLCGCGGCGGATLGAEDEEDN